MTTGPPPRRGRFPSLDLALEEARFIWETEQNRHDALQSKAATIMGTAGILMTLLALPNSFQDWQVRWLVAVFLGSLLSGLGVLWIRGYKVPHGPVEDFFQHAKMTRADVEDMFLLDYINAITHNRKINDLKLWFLRASLILLVAGLVLAAWFFYAT